MKTISVSLAIIGAGPAGLAAAVEAKNQGVDDIIVLERDREAGGILQQCIHDGFGLHRFGKQLSGCQYAQNFINFAQELDINILCNTMVLTITPDKTIYACNEQDGMIEIKAKAVILTMGCRERTQSQAFIHGSRPSGVMTAGSAQRYINMEGYLPGKNAVILGSGDIGLIMARRMTLEGINVKGVYELMSSPGGLTRNIVQCLDDYGIPLHLSTTVTKIHSNQRVERITIAKVDENRKPIKGTEEIIDCDLLVLAVGLIPENELSVKAGITIDEKTKGPIVDENFMTSIPGIFAAGNVVAVFDLVDYVSITGEVAARGAAAYINGNYDCNDEHLTVQAGENVNFVVPQLIRKNQDLNDVNFFMRVKQPKIKARLEGMSENEKIYSKTHVVVAPPEMLSCVVTKKSNSDLLFKVTEV